MPAGYPPAHTFPDENARRSSCGLRVPELPTLLEALPEPAVQPENPSREQAAIAAEQTQQGQVCFQQSTAGA